MNICIIHNQFRKSERAYKQLQREEGGKGDDGSDGGTRYSNGRGNLNL